MRPCVENPVGLVIGTAVRLPDASVRVDSRTGASLPVYRKLRVAWATAIEHWLILIRRHSKVQKANRRITPSRRDFSWRLRTWH